MNKDTFLNNLQKQEKNYKISKMVEEINKEFPLQDEVKSALLSIDREIFMPKAFKHFAYTLDALPIAGKQYISSPLTVAKMTQYLEPQKDLKVLEIGCGSGYQAAILSKLFSRVFTIERIERLLNEAKERFKELDLRNILTKFDDGTKGWDVFAPYDRILFSAAATEIPETIFDQLKEGGVLLAPIFKGNKQVLVKYSKQNGLISQKVLEESRFVPIIQGKEY
jgi:protein-L-isoaspartate(D-aspartate) O-methyltransferase